MDKNIYQIALIGLLTLGLVLALTFLAQFRPKQWRRLAAWDAAGLIVVIALWYIRSLGVLAIRWPHITVPGFWDGIVSIGLLIIIDALLVLRVLNFRAFAHREASAQHPEDH